VNKTLKAVITATLLVGSASVARADLNAVGEVGLPLNPTAQIPNQGGVRVQADYFDFGSLDIGGVGSVGDFKFYGLHGAGTVAKRLEINGGFDHFKASENTSLVPSGTFDPLDRSGISLGAKYLITSEAQKGIQVAVGAGYNRALLKNEHVYVVATKTLGAISGDRTPMAGHLGLRWDRYKLSDLASSIDDSKKVSVYAGLEVPVTRDGNFTVVGELQSKNQEFDKSTGTAWPAKVPYSVSVRFRPPGQGFSGSIGMQRQGITGDTGLFIQLGYTFATGNH